MKLYDFPGAPNPRRVKIFAAEKDIELEIINCDLAKGEHKTPEFIKKMKDPEHKIEFHEEIELKELYEAIHSILETFNPDKVFFLDLHNTSSPRGTFAVSFCPEIQNNLKNNFSNYFIHFIVSNCCKSTSKFGINFVQVFRRTV